MLKVLDGTNWQGYFDNSADEVTSAQGAANIAKRFRDLGVPVMFWTVPRGLSDATLEQEIRLSREVIDASRHLIDGFVLDTEPYDYFWEGTPDRARQLVRALRGRGTTIWVAPDARPWHLGGSMQAFCEEAEGIMPQAYWRTFQGNCPYYVQAGYQCPGITAEFLARVTREVFRKFNKKIGIIGQGDASAADWRTFNEVSEKNGTEVMAVWRQGVTPDDVIAELGRTSGGEEEDMGYTDEKFAEAKAYTDRQDNQLKVVLAALGKDTFDLLAASRALQAIAVNHERRIIALSPASPTDMSELLEIKENLARYTETTDNIVARLQAMKVALDALDD